MISTITLLKVKLDTPHSVVKRTERSRNKEEKTNTKINTPLSLSQGGSHNELTVRDRRRLNDLIYSLQQPIGRPGDPHYHPGLDFETALQTACGQLMLPIHAARSAARAAGLEVS